MSCDLTLPCVAQFVGTELVVVLLLCVLAPVIQFFFIACWVQHCLRSSTPSTTSGGFRSSTLTAFYLMFFSTFAANEL